jgi:uncharacterized protein YndB with AHSA1/START domain/predicted enzyme related to lactoylglutathione lyase
MSEHERAEPEQHRIDLSVEVTGTPEEVWTAIATGAGVSAWLHHTEIDGRPGRRFAYDMGIDSGPGAGLNDTGRVAAYEPPHRFATEGVRWAPANGAEPAELATEWTVEARDGGTCVVRMVMSGFGRSAAWDEEIEGMTGGMRAALESLRRHLSRPGPRQVLAAVGVADRVAAMPFYETLFGRPADAVPMPSDAEWTVGDSTLQVVEAPDRAGRSMATLVTDDLRGWVPELRTRGIEVGEIDDSPGTVLYVQLTDPEGNLLTLVQQLA